MPKLRVLKQVCVVCVVPVRRTERPSYWNAVRREVGKEVRAARKGWSSKAKFRPSAWPCTDPTQEGFLFLSTECPQNRFLSMSAALTLYNGNIFPVWGPGGD